MNPKQHRGTNIVKLANLRRDKHRDRFIQQMKKDTTYILKPKPRIVPMIVWVYILSKFIKLDKLNTKNICQQLELQPTK